MEKRAVIAIVNYKNKILLGKKKKDSPKVLAGEWHIPAETIENDESDESALIRGIKEETSLEITVGDYLCSDITPTSQRNVRWYECFANTQEITIGSDLEDAKWVTKKEALNTCSPRAIKYWPEKILNYFKE